jgi:drug/metabolite transporter (DMT)-like permease
VTTDPPRDAPAAATRTTTARAFGRREVAVLLALSSMWGLSFLFIEVALRQLGPLWIVAGRTVVGGLVLLGLLRLRGRQLPRGWGVWKHLFVLGSINNAVPWAAVAWAQRSLPSGLVALLMALVPTSTLLVSAAVRIERITAPRLAGLLLALGGVAVIVGGDLDDIGRVVAVLTVAGATILYAVGAVYAKRSVSGRVSALQLATGQVLCAAVVTVPAAAIVEGRSVPFGALEPLTIASIVALGALGTGAAFYLFYLLIERVGATNTTLTTYLIPLVAIVAGTLLLDERLGWAALAGGLLIGGGIALSQRDGSRRLVPPVDGTPPRDDEAGADPDHAR